MIFFFIVLNVDEETAVTAAEAVLVRDDLDVFPSILAMLRGRSGLLDPRPERLLSLKTRWMADFPGKSS